MVSHSISETIFFQIECSRVFILVMVVQCRNSITYFVVFNYRGVIRLVIFINDVCDRGSL